MTFEEILDQAIALLERRGRVTYRTLKRQFNLNDDALEDLKAEIIKGQRLAVDEDGEVLVWTAGATSPLTSTAEPARAPLDYTPTHLVEKILTSRAALEGERKQVTVLLRISRVRWSYSPTGTPRRHASSWTRCWSA